MTKYRVVESDHGDEQYYFIERWVEPRWFGKPRWERYMENVGWDFESLYSTKDKKEAIETAKKLSLKHPPIHRVVEQIS